MRLFLFEGGIWSLRLEGLTAKLPDGFPSCRVECCKLDKSEFRVWDYGKQCFELWGFCEVSGNPAHMQVAESSSDSESTAAFCDVQTVTCGVLSFG